MHDFISFLWEERSQLGVQILEHLVLTFLSLWLAVLLGLPLGIAITRYKKAASTVLGYAGIMQTIPSIALLGFLIPFLGIGEKPAILALFLYALLPIIRNSYTGIQEIDPAIKEAAKGMGMTSWQVLFKIELPLAMPIIFAGIRTATVINVGVATLAAYIAAGGLGEFIFSGIALNNSNMILAGAVPAALLAIFLDTLLAKMQQLPFQQLVKASAVLFGLSLMALLWNYSPKINASNFKLLKAGFEPEFVGRADGYPRLREVYGLELEIKTLNATLMYKAVKEKEVDVISGYSTDGRVQAFDLKVLKDDKNAFPPYQAAFLIREESLLKWPKLAALLGALEGILSDSLMTALNYQADFLKHPPDSVAQGFVQQLNLELPDLAGQASGEVLRVGSKIFTEQYILVEILRLLVEQHTLLTLDAKTGLGGTKICFDALLAGEIDLYPEYTGTGLQVMLQPSSDTLSQLIRDERATFHYVEREFKGRYNLVWMPPLGFNNSYALMMRKEQTESLDVHSISDLTQLFNLDK